MMQTATNTNKNSIEFSPLVEIVEEGKAQRSVVVQSPIGRQSPFPMLLMQQTRVIYLIYHRKLSRKVSSDPLFRCVVTTFWGLVFCFSFYTQPWKSTIINHGSNVFTRTDEQGLGPRARNTLDERNRCESKIKHVPFRLYCIRSQESCHFSLHIL